MEPLPGVSAQHLMAPKMRKTTPELLNERTSHRLSSVMMLLYPDQAGILTTIFIERPTDSSIHSGQIAFPGGKMDETDDNPARTAVRETEEEIGVAASSIEIIGTLSQLFIPASNFLVIPHLGVLKQTPTFIPSPGEVQSLIPMHISSLLEMKPSEKEFPTSYGNLLAPYFDFNGHAVWGATAMMLSEFREMIGDK